MTRIARFLTPAGPVFGLVENSIAYALPGDPFSAPLQPGEPLGTVESLKLLPPVQPSKIICVGRNYAAHAAEHSAPVPEEPMLFLKPPSALVGAGDPIVIPQGIGRVEHEAELAVIIGRPAQRVAQHEALSYVLGYTCANDVSARDLQRKDSQWGRAKGFDTFCPLGPWIVTELDPRDVEVRCRVNGEQRQRARTAEMVFDVSALIAFISRVMTLLPGDVILTGTPAGVSPLAEGDTVEVEIEGIGVLRNPVHSGLAWAE
ncbi:MAG: fumarylacetoacetate hydrolase family protein [Aggregatilineaceae bacterium]